MLLEKMRIMVYYKTTVLFKDKKWYEMITWNEINDEINDVWIRITDRWKNDRCIILFS